jgi:hypothetical protein
MISSKLTKILAVLCVTKNIVISANQNLVAVQSANDINISLIDNNVPKVVDLIVRTNGLIPARDHILIHLVRIIPRPKSAYAIFGKKFAYT